jgi:methyl-accepting chemotaxis protein
MRAFLNLPVGFKLFLSVLAALLMMAVLVVRTDTSLSGVVEENVALAQAGNADDALRNAVVSSAQAALSSLRAGTAQTPAAVAEALKATTEQLTQLRSHVERAVRDATGEGRQLAQAILPLIDDYAAALKDVADERQKLLDKRDRALFPSMADYDQRFEALSSSLEFDISDPSKVEEVRQRMMSFHASVGDMRTTIQRYLGTEDPAQLTRLRRTVAQQRVYGSGLEKGPFSASLVEDVKRLANASQVIANAANDAVASLAAINTIRDEKVEPLRQRIATQLNAASAALAQDVSRRNDTVATALGTVKRETLIAGGLIALVLILTGIASTKAISSPVRRQVAILNKIAAGDATVTVTDTQRKDEIGAIAKAVERLRGVVGEAFAQRQMLEQMPLGVMMADPKDEFRITYVNASMKEILTDKIPEMLPVPVDQVMTQSLDIFHSEPARQRELLSNPDNLPHRARMEMGKEVMELSVSAIRDAAGNYVGPMAVWRVMTDQARLATTFEGQVGSVLDVLAGRAAEMRQAARQLSQVATESGQEASTVAEAASRASADVQGVAAAAEEMAASIVEITRRVSEAAAVTEQAVQEARATDDTMRGLADSASRIGDVVKLIGSIAGQTNLLALNATIEAARAGEAGKGFAVVAAEVKNLAGQTAKATEEISNQIAEMQGATDRAVTAIRAIGQTVERTNEISTAIAAAVEEQGAATQEIARSANQVAEATNVVTQRIGTVREAAQQTGTAAGGMLGATEELAEQTGHLKRRAGEFLTALR